MLQIPLLGKKNYLQISLRKFVSTLLENLNKIGKEELPPEERHREFSALRITLVPDVCEAAPYITWRKYPGKNSLGVHDKYSKVLKSLLSLHNS